MNRKSKRHFQEWWTLKSLVPVTMAWHILRLQMEEWPPKWRVTENILKKQLQTVYKEWSSSLGVGQSANNSP